MAPRSASTRVRRAITTAMAAAASRMMAYTVTLAALLAYCTPCRARSSSVSAIKDTPFNRPPKTAARAEWRNPDATVISTKDAVSGIIKMEP